MYNIFASVKAAVTARQAAEYYGFQVNRNGMICSNGITASAAMRPAT